MATLEGTIELGGVEVPEEVRKWIVSTFSRHEQDEKERKSKWLTHFGSHYIIYYQLFSFFFFSLNLRFILFRVQKLDFIQQYVAFLFDRSFALIYLLVLLRLWFIIYC